MTSPKTRLLKNTALARTLDDAVSSPHIDEAVQTAFAEFCFQLRDANPAAADMRRQGALEFAIILQNIGHPVVMPPRSLPPDLNPPPQR